MRRGKKGKFIFLQQKSCNFHFSKMYLLLLLLLLLLFWQPRWTKLATLFCFHLLLFQNYTSWSAMHHSVITNLHFSKFTKTTVNLGSKSFWLFWDYCSVTFTKKLNWWLLQKTFLRYFVQYEKLFHLFFKFCTCINVGLFFSKIIIRSKWNRREFRHKEGKRKEIHCEVCCNARLALQHTNKCLEKLLQ